ncbi:MAG: hypothetical protein VXY56_05585, partial [Pseudomonadota bacterium]|nr:hypothetical protein [Pseudomonadota bacterium]
KKFELIKQNAEITWVKALDITRHQFGKFLKAFRDFYQDDTEVLDLLMPKSGGYPKRLQPIVADYSRSMPLVC